MQNSPTQKKSSASLPQRLLWFIALWSAGVFALTIVAYGLRVFMRALGLTL